MSKIFPAFAFFPVVAVFAVVAAFGASAEAPKVLVAPYSGIISPVTAEFLGRAVSKANSEDYEALVILLDTPGGLDPSMREIVKAILNSKVPVVTYVHPSGARAASAGVFITMASHVAAMSPGTNIGAAHPVMIGTMPSAPDREKPGKDGKGKEKEDSHMEKKVVSDASAYLKSIAHQRKRNESWAQEAVTQSTSITAGEALALNVIDYVSPSLEDLLGKIDGKIISALDGKRLRTKGALVVRYEMTRRQKLLATLSDPNIALILMSLGAAGLFIELYNPGLILPGVVGAVSLILGFYSFQTLSANYAGILLILFGWLLFLAEIKVTSYGLLTVGGIVSNLLGILMLFSHHELGGIQIAHEVIFGYLGTMLAVTGFLAYMVLRAHKRTPVTGEFSLIGKTALALNDLNPSGQVQVQGEIWNAESLEGLIPAQSQVMIVEVSGLTLKVRKI